MNFTFGCLWRRGALTAAAFLTLHALVDRSFAGDDDSYFDIDSALAEEAGFEFRPLQDWASRDVYRPDNRRPATNDEKRWIVNVRGCTGSMLTSEYVLTANHCTPRIGDRYTSGGCMVTGNCTNDLTVAERTECNSNLDYCVVKVKGTNAAALLEQRYTWRVMRQISDIKTGADTVATPLFTIGFPGDKNGVATFSPGFAKQTQTETLLYNAGSINGNSGGAVWRTSDRTLVTMTNFGRLAIGQPGWNSADPQDSSAWNGGGRMDVIYKQSKIFKKLYPDGRNLFVDATGELLDPPVVFVDPRP